MLFKKSILNDNDVNWSGTCTSPQRVHVLLTDLDDVNFRLDLVVEVGKRPLGGVLLAHFFIP